MTARSASCGDRHSSSVRRGRSRRRPAGRVARRMRRIGSPCGAAYHRVRTVPASGQVRGVLDCGNHDRGGVLVLWQPLRRGRTSRRPRPELRTLLLRKPRGELRDLVPHAGGGGDLRLPPDRLAVPAGGGRLLAVRRSAAARPLAGTAADRFDKRRLLLVTQGAASAIAAALTVVVMTGAATSATVIAFGPGSDSCRRSPGRRSRRSHRTWGHWIAWARRSR